MKNHVRKRLKPTFQDICHLMSPDILDDPQRELRNLSSKLSLVCFHRVSNEAQRKRRQTFKPSSMDEQTSSSSGHVATSYCRKIQLSISSLTTIVAAKIKVSDAAKACDSERLNHSNFYFEFRQVE